MVRHAQLEINGVKAAFSLSRRRRHDRRVTDRGDFNRRRDIHTQRQIDSQLRLVYFVCATNVLVQTHRRGFIQMLGERNVDAG